MVVCALLVPDAAAMIFMRFRGNSLRESGGLERLSRATQNGIVGSSATRVPMARLMNVFSTDKSDPLIGSAGVGAVRTSARVSQVEGHTADPTNWLPMHALAPNVAGVIGTALVAGYFIAAIGR